MAHCRATVGALDHRHEPVSARPPGHRHRAAQSHRRRCVRQCRQGVSRRHGRRRRRSGRPAGIVPGRLSAGRPGAQAGLPSRLPRRRRKPGAHDPERARHAGRYTLGRGRQALQCGRAPGRRQAGGATLQGRSAQLRSVRREAGVRARPAAGTDQFPRRAHRRAHLRGRLGAGAGGMHRRDRRRDPAGAERLAVSPWHHRPAPERRGGAGRRGRSAARLRQPGRRPGRTGVRRRVLRPQCRSLDAGPARRLPRGGGDHPLGARECRLALPAGAGRGARGQGSGRLHRLHAGPARLCEQERLSGRGAGPVGGHRFRPVCGTRGRRPRGGAGALRHAALQVHVAGLARRRGGLRQGARRPVRHRVDRRRGRGARTGPGAADWRDAPATSPRRTCRRERAAPC